MEDRTLDKKKLTITLSKAKNDCWKIKTPAPALRVSLPVYIYHNLRKNQSKNLKQLLTLDQNKLSAKPDKPKPILRNPRRPVRRYIRRANAAEKPANSLAYNSNFPIGIVSLLQPDAIVSFLKQINAQIPQSPLNNPNDNVASTDENINDKNISHSLTGEPSLNTRDGDNSNTNISDDVDKIDKSNNELHKVQDKANTQTQTNDVLVELDSEKQKRTISSEEDPKDPTAPDNTCQNILPVRRQSNCNTVEQQRNTGTNISDDVDITGKSNNELHKVHDKANMQKQTDDVLVELDADKKKQTISSREDPKDPTAPDDTSQNILPVRKQSNCNTVEQQRNIGTNVSDDVDMIDKSNNELHKVQDKANMQTRTDDVLVELDSDKEKQSISSEDHQKDPTAPDNTSQNILPVQRQWNCNTIEQQRDIEANTRSTEIVVYNPNLVSTARTTSPNTAVISGLAHPEVPIPTVATPFLPALLRAPSYSRESLDLAYRNLQLLPPPSLSVIPPYNPFPPPISPTLPTPAPPWPYQLPTASTMTMSSSQNPATRLHVPLDEQAIDLLMRPQYHSTTEIREEMHRSFPKLFYP